MSKSSATTKAPMQFHLKIMNFVTVQYDNETFTDNF